MSPQGRSEKNPGYIPYQPCFVCKVNTSQFFLTNACKSIHVFAVMWTRLGQGTKRCSQFTGLPIEGGKSKLLKMESQILLHLFEGYVQLNLKEGKATFLKNVLLLKYIDYSLIYHISTTLQSLSSPNLICFTFC